MHWKPNPLLYPQYLRARVRRGRGVGDGLSYISWLTTRDVPSDGTSSIIHGIHINRPYHLLSELEAIYFLILERKPSSADIKEQWPILDIDRTLELCAKYGVRHPYRGSYPEPFTIDFLITTDCDGKLKCRAASIKTPEDAKDPTVRLRLTIEYVWCREHGIPWTLVDTSAFGETLLERKTFLANLRFIRAWFRHQYAPDRQRVVHFSQRFNSLYRTNVPLDELIHQAAKTLHLTDTSAQDTFRYCAWADLIKLSLKHPLAMNLPLVLRRNHDRA